VAIFAADHVYRMDVRQIVDFHTCRHADVTVAAVPVPIADAREFGVIEADRAGRIIEFKEKPAHPTAMSGDPQHAYASMGNYLFDPRVLVDLLHATVTAGETDFGHHLLPRAIAGGAAVFAYDFSDNRVPGTQEYEQRSYWRDVGTLDALARARQETVGPTPRFDLRNQAWPLRPTRNVQPKSVN
jgi:glucose-1-phosphate adenylyltransferase